MQRMLVPLAIAGAVGCTESHSGLPVGGAGAVGPVSRIEGVDLLAGDSNSCLRTVAGQMWCWGNMDLVPRMEIATPLMSGCIVGHQPCGIGPDGRVFLPGDSESPYRLPAGAALSCGLATACVQLGADFHCFFYSGSTTFELVPPYNRDGVTVHDVGVERLVVGGEFGAELVFLGTPTREVRRVLDVPVFELLVVGSDGCGLTGAGSLACWGNFAELLPSSGRSAPPLRSVDGMHRHTCGVDAAGTVFCWGRTGCDRYDAAERPPNDCVDRNWEDATRIGLVAPALSIAVGLHHSCALLQNHEVWCWGSNYYGQLGDGTRVDSEVPVRVRLPSE